jgi:sugar phosphate isomerase/epimerase
VRISVITDELSSDLDTALELAVEMGFEGVELRGIGEGRYPRVSDLAAVRTPELIREYGLPAVNISPGLFKIGLPELVPNEARALRWDDALAFGDERAGTELLTLHNGPLLQKCIEAAKAVGSPRINCFAFNRTVADPEAAAPEAAVRALRDAARAMAPHGLTLTIENEMTTWASTARNSVELIRRIGEPNVGLTWDPGNAHRAGEDRPYPEGWALVKDIIRHVHLKNSAIDPASGARYFTFDGAVDWAGQIKALRDARYDGYISIETHVRPKLATTKRYLAMLRELQAQ